MRRAQSARIPGMSNVFFCTGEHTRMITGLGFVTPQPPPPSRARSPLTPTGAEVSVSPPPPPPAPPPQKKNAHIYRAIILSSSRSGTILCSCYFLAFATLGCTPCTRYLTLERRWRPEPRGIFHHELSGRTLRIRNRGYFQSPPPPSNIPAEQ